MYELQQFHGDGHGSMNLPGYGDLGSTYDLQNGGRPLRRSEAAVVVSTPWATQQPVGLARLLPGDLRGTPKLGVGDVACQLNQQKPGWKKQIQRLGWIC